MTTRFETPQVAADTNHRTTHLEFLGLHGCIIVSKAPGGLNTITGSSSSILRWPQWAGGTHLDSNPANMLQHLGDIGEESCILYQS